MDPPDEDHPLLDRIQGNEETADVFSSLIVVTGPPRIRPTINKFVKNLDDNPEISLPPALPRRVALSLTEHGLVRQFTRPCPSPKLVQRW